MRYIHVNRGAVVIKSVNRKVHLGEDVLSYVFGVCPVVQDSVKDAKNLGLMALDELTKGGLIACTNSSREIQIIGHPRRDRLLAAKCTISGRWSR
jgi:hypothetical protein